MISFDSDYLNQDELYKRAVSETALIISGTTASHRNRSADEIILTCMRGQAAEQYLIEKWGFTDDPRRYKDLFNTNGESVEVKVTSKQSNVKYVIGRLNGYRKEAWRNISDIVYVFINDPANTIYYLEGVYKWNILEIEVNEVCPSVLLL